MAMQCVSCGKPAAQIKDSRPRDDGSIKRYRECVACGHRFVTFERPDVPAPGKVNVGRAAA